MSVSQLEQPMDESHQSKSSSARVESNKEVEPSLEQKYEYYVEGLRKYETFLRDGYFDIYHKEVEYQLQRNGLIFDTEFGINSKVLQNYEKYKKFLYNEHNKMIGIEIAEEGHIRKDMLASCMHMKWTNVEKILDRRQKIVMKRKQALFDNELAYMTERSKIMLRSQYYKDNDGMDLFVKESRLADYLTAQGELREYKID